MICGEVGTEKGAHTQIHLGHAAVLLKQRTDEIFEQVRLCNQQLEALESEFDRALTIEDADKQQNLLIEISDKQNLNEQLIDELVLYQAPKLLGKERKTFSKFNQTGEKLSTIGFEVNTITNLGQDKKITLTPNYT